MRMMSIASGSSGNCIYIGSDNTHILIDAGISRKRIREGLNLAGIDMADISAVMLTHEHSDHVSGVGVVMRNDNIPFYSTRGTIQAVLSSGKSGDIPKELFQEIDNTASICIGDLEIRACPVSHDAADPVAYTVSCEARKAGVITDLGVYDDKVINHLKGCDAFLAEANYDIRMLEAGPYPYELKRRIQGDRGHLSNEESGRLVSNLLHDDIKTIFLGHLSKENNYELLAYETVTQEVDTSDTEYKGSDFNIEVAGRYNPSTIIEF